MKRIAIGQIQQETNTFNPRRTERASFENFGWAEGEKVLTRYGESGEIAGFTHLPEALGEQVAWLGLVRAKEVAGGPIDDELVAELISILRAGLEGKELDGVIISLHGALTSAEIADVDGYILEKIRSFIGPALPLVATLDLHANITRQMIASADVLVGYHTFPHIDHLTCGQRAARALAKLIKEGCRAKIHAVKIPMIVNAKGFTTTDVLMSDLYDRCVRAENETGVLSVGIYMAQPWLDVPEQGWTIYQAYIGEHPPLDPAVIVNECWEKRVFNARRLPGPDAIIAQALTMPGHPIVVSEGHDATNSGAPGDSTRLLAALLRHEFPEGGALTFCVDPGSVRACLAAGEGADVTLRVGAIDDPYSEPLPLTAKVVSRCEIKFPHSGHGGHSPCPLIVTRAPAARRFPRRPRNRTLSTRRSATP